MCEIVMCNEDCESENVMKIMYNTYKGRRKTGSSVISRKAVQMAKAKVKGHQRICWRRKNRNGKSGRAPLQKSDSLAFMARGGGVRLQAHFAGGAGVAATALFSNANSKAKRARQQHPEQTATARHRNSASRRTRKRGIARQNRGQKNIST